jgi:hypothetical protein
MPAVVRTLTGTPHADSFWEEVPPNSVSTKDVVIPNGQTWKVVQFIASAAFLDDTEVRLVWDLGGGTEEILGLTHGDMNMSLDKELVGDGTKKLAIVLTNDTAATHAIGGCYEAIDF